MLHQRGVFLLHVTDTNSLLPVQPIGLGLLQVSVLLCIFTTFVNGVDQVLYYLAAELTVLVRERTTATDDLVNVLTNAEFAQLVRRDVHSDLLGLRTKRIVHHQHVPYLVANLSVHVFVKI